MLVDSLLRTVANPPGFEWVVLIALTVLAGSFTLSLPSLPVKFSVSETFIFTAALLCGPAPAALAIAIDILVISYWRHEVRRTPTRFLFNLTAPAIAIRLASEVFYRVMGEEPGATGGTSFGTLFWPVLGLAMPYFAINTLLIAGLMAAERGSAAVKMWRRNLPAVSVNYFVVGSFRCLLSRISTRSTSPSSES